MFGFSDITSALGDVASGLNDYSSATIGILGGGLDVLAPGTGKYAAQLNSFQRGLVNSYQSTVDGTGNRVLKPTSNIRPQSSYYTNNSPQYQNKIAPTQTTSNTDYILYGGGFLLVLGAILLIFKKK